MNIPDEPRKKQAIRITMQAWKKLILLGLTPAA